MTTAGVPGETTVGVGAARAVGVLPAAAAACAEALFAPSSPAAASAACEEEEDAAMAAVVLVFPSALPVRLLPAPMSSAASMFCRCRSTSMVSSMMKRVTAARPRQSAPSAYLSFGGRLFVLAALLSARPAPSLDVA